MAPGSWTDAPTADAATCDIGFYVTIDLKRVFSITSVVVWHYTQE